MSGHTPWSQIRRRRASDLSVREAVAVMDEILAAWADLEAATPPGWSLGQPSLYEDRHEWSLCAFGPPEQPKAGMRRREVEATVVEGAGAAEVIRQLTRRLADLEADWVRQHNPVDQSRSKLRIESPTLSDRN